MYLLLSVLGEGVILENHIWELDRPRMGEVVGSIVGGWGCRVRVNF